MRALKEVSDIRIVFLKSLDLRHPEAGGAEIYVHEIAKRLALKGDEVIILSSRHPSLPAEEIVDSVKILRRGGRYSANLLIPLYYLRELHKKADVVVDEYTTAPFMTPAYAGEKAILLVHLLAGERIKYEVPRSIAWLSPLLRALEPKVLRVYRRTRVIAVSESTASELRAIGINRIRIVEPGIDPDKYRNGPKAPEPLVLYFGRIVPYKGVIEAIKAFSLIRREVKDAKMVVAGKCRDRAFLLELKNLALDLGIKDGLSFLPNVSEERKVELLAKSWILLLPSLKEGFNIVCLEAAASAVPIVGYNVPGMRDAVKIGVTGLLVSKGDVKGLADAAISILSDPRTLEVMRRQSREWALNFTWDRAAEKFRRLLLEEW